MSPFREIAVLTPHSQNRQPAYRARKRHSTARLQGVRKTQAKGKAGDDAVPAVHYAEHLHTGRLRNTGDTQGASQRSGGVAGHA